MGRVSCVHGGDASLRGARVGNLLKLVEDDGPGFNGDRCIARNEVLWVEASFQAEAKNAEEEDDYDGEDKDKTDQRLDSFLVVGSIVAGGA